MVNHSIMPSSHYPNSFYISTVNQSPQISTYIPGLHCLADLKVVDATTLNDHTALKTFWEDLISELGLTRVGDVYHQFPEGGFTAVICLTESHISIHTWPEHGYATMDVFLSNYKQVNDGKAEEIVKRTAAFLGVDQVELIQHRR